MTLLQTNKLDLMECHAKINEPERAKFVVAGIFI
jgi:hypothetical protein